ncbi:MAG: aspartate kinase [Candidatus Eremiobacteraeota bacterium]|nr:aspartate kinase [Candidatus Eremiobacteraeota bacterium]MBV8355744.1 aspartate kinase [Candidatus Eremiobacteraeota bacterium]
MNAPAAPRVLIQKFGGSSLATAELREIAASRVLEARTRGYAPVVVCSAMGRSPEVYATDTLLALLGPARSGPNRDLLGAVGELIACAVFAELLSSWGATAQAMTGAQAGIRTSSNWGDAGIESVEPGNLVAAIVAGIIPVVAGFQGADSSGAITTLGRGGSDLTAIAIGDVLGAEEVEIYTDVSGVMSGDPRRIAGAHTVGRVNWSEMVELAGNGAKVMHAKAATYAQRANTPYVIKGLRSNFGTAIDEGTTVDRERPVTGVTSLKDIAFVRIIQGEENVTQRAALDRQLLRRIAERGASIDMINVNSAGVFFVCDSENVEVVREELRDMNLAVRIRSHCAKISIVGAGMRGTPGVMYRVVRAVVDAGVEIIHSTDSNITISVLVPEEDADRAEQALHDAFQLGRRDAPRHSEALQT